MPVGKLLAEPLHQLLVHARRSMARDRKPRVTGIELKPIDEMASALVSALTFRHGLACPAVSFEINFRYPVHWILVRLDDDPHLLGVTHRRTISH